jgi:hypothetical protein
LDDQKIRVHAFYCVLALTLASLLRRRLSQLGVDPSVSTLLDQLSELCEVVHIYPPQAKKKDMPTLSLTNATQQLLVDKLGLMALQRSSS